MLDYKRTEHSTSFEWERLCTLLQEVGLAIVQVISGPPIGIPVALDHICSVLLPNGSDVEAIVYEFERLVFEKRLSDTQWTDDTLMEHVLKLSLQVPPDPRRLQAVRHAVVQIAFGSPINAPEALSILIAELGLRVFAHAVMDGGTTELATGLRMAILW